MMKKAVKRLITGRRGRRPAAEKSAAREAILAAASELFAERGMDGASIRDIASRAGVDPALVHYFFGDKDRLFKTAIRPPYSLEEILEVMRSPREDLGRNLARFALVTVFEERSEAASALLRTVISTPGGPAIMRGVIENVVAPVIGSALGGEDGRLRAQMAASWMLGLFVIRRIIRVNPLAGLEAERLVELVAPILQQILTGPLPSPVPAVEPEKTP
ncbi:MAG: HTH-type transcriptional regulator BetI [Myxococcota bacterium]|nr:HTH-type transcriptional regulator BetI [Myxococcota bacterium]